MSRQPHSFSGYTLIELLVVVVILGLLMAIALPAYRYYTVRSQMSELIACTQDAKALVNEAYSNTGSLPADNEEAGYGGCVGKYTISTSIATGVITATAGNRANTAIVGKTIKLTPLPSAVTGHLVWTCSTDADQEFVATICRAGAN